MQGQSPVNTPANAGKGLDDGKAERRQLRDAYKAECKRHGVTVTDEMICQEANPNWTDRTAVQKWLACDPRYNGAADAAIRRVLRDKPHLRRG